MPKPTIDPIAALVAEHIAGRGISVPKLAADAGMKHPNLYQWLAGDRGLPVAPRTRVLRALGLRIKLVRDHSRH